jgi:integrase
MTIKIDTVTSRDNLKARHAPYWQKIRMECHLGYRKITSESSGAWIARYRDISGKYQLHSLGSLESFLPHRRYDEAVKLAIEWFDHRKSGGISVSITVADACQRYIDKLRGSGKENGAVDVEGRFKRWIFSDIKLSKTALIKLTPGVLNDWRMKLVTTPALLQDKSKTATKLRSASSVNRDMAVLKAALNLAREDGYANTDNAWKTKLKPIKNADNRRDCYLDIEQRRKLISNAPADLAALLKTMSLIPLRPGAVAALTVNNLDKRLGVLTIGKDKSGRDRKITLPPSTTAFLVEQIKDKPTNAPLISRADGQPWNKDAWKFIFKSAAKEAGLPDSATAYALRHSTITDLIVLHRLDTMTVAQISGTSLPMIEKHYGHLLRDHAANALAGLAI